MVLMRRKLGSRAGGLLGMAVGYVVTRMSRSKP